MLSLDPRITSARNIFNGYKDGNLTFEQFLELSQQNCYYCGNHPHKSNIYNRYKNRTNTVLENINSANFYYNGLDRLDSSKLHNIDNVVPCCKICNSAKMEQTSIEFDSWIEQVYQILQKRKGS